MLLLIIIPLLFAVSCAGFAWVLAEDLRAGMEAYSGTYSQKVARQFEDVFLFIPARRIAELGWIAAGLAFLGIFILFGGLRSTQGFFVGMSAGAIAALLALRLPACMVKVLKARRLAKFNVQLGDALVNMSNALKAGFSIVQAFESVVREGENPIAQEFDVFLRQIRVGVNFSEALASLAERVGGDDVKLLVAAVEAARKTGGNLTEVFEKISATIRERLRIENRIRTLTAQGRLQGVVVSIMPIVIGVAMLMVDPDMMLPFLHSTLGIVIMALVAGLIALGALIIRRIINIDV